MGGGFLNLLCQFLGHLIVKTVCLKIKPGAFVLYQVKILSIPLNHTYFAIVAITLDSG